MSRKKEPPNNLPAPPGETQTPDPEGQKWLAEQYRVLVDGEGERTRFLESKLSSSLSTLWVALGALVGVGSLLLTAQCISVAPRTGLWWHDLLPWALWILGCMALIAALFMAIGGSIARGWAAINDQNFQGKSMLTEYQFFGRLALHYKDIYKRNHAQNQHKGAYLKWSQKLLLIGTIIIVSALVFLIVKFLVLGKWITFK